MAVAWRTQRLPSNPSSKPLQNLFLETWSRMLVTGGGGADLCEDNGPNGPRPGLQTDTGCNHPYPANNFNASTWKVVDSRSVGIKKSSVSSSTWDVLRILQSRGFKAYLVGGCVRDLLLRKTPKDFDVITTASLQEVKRQFHRVIVVGRQFPICRVYIKGSIIEVSSFETSHKNAEERKSIPDSQLPPDCEYSTLIRWKNCFKRDFTINSLFFDPYAGKIYDYVNGMRDIRASKVRTVIPAHLSFQEDSARILRGLRIAARLGLSFSKETEAAIRDLSSTIVTLDKSRLMMEMNFMMAYGAAKPSICLLQKFKLLDILLPLHAVYLTQESGCRTGCSMLMRLLECVDRLLSADRPCHCSLWLALLAFHLTLFLHPQDALVIWTFSSILYYGDWKKAVKYAKESATIHDYSFPEIRSWPGYEDDSLLEAVSLLASLVRSTFDTFIHPGSLEARMLKHQGHDSARLVFVSQKKGKSVAELFVHLETDLKSYKVKRETCGVNYKLLEQGDLHEVRFVLGKVIIDAMTVSIGCANRKTVL